MINKGGNKSLVDGCQKDSIEDASLLLNYIQRSSSDFANFKFRASSSVFVVDVLEIIASNTYTISDNGPKKCYKKATVSKNKVSFVFLCP